VKKPVLAFLMLMLSLAAFSQDSARVATDSIPRKIPSRKIPSATPEADQPRVGSAILDDSTKSVYGPETTQWMTEREFFSGQPNYRPLDTTVNNFHRWTRVQQLDNFYHDLGNNGTALNPIFPSPVETIGASPGFQSYGQYIKAYDLKIYDTHSPFTRVYFIWGSEGRALTDAEWSRNITPKWNLSFSYRALLSDKQVLRQGKGDRQVIQHYYDIHTHYSTPKDRYKVRVSYQRIRHRVRENGGLILTGSDSSYASYFEQPVATELRWARNAEQQNNIHLQHQVGIKQIQLYHEFDVKRQVNWFRDELKLENADYYDNIRLDPDSIERSVDSVRFATLNNRLGIKGNFGKRNQFFYNGYARVRNYNQFNWNMTRDTLAMPMKGTEYYLGGELQYAIDSLQSISGLLEAMEGGYSRVVGSLNTRWLDAGLRAQISKPTMLQNGYVGTFDLWDNSFSPVRSIQVTAFPKLTWGPLALAAGGTYTQFQNYVYFARRDTFPGTFQRVLPVQSNQPAAYVTPEVRLDLAIGKVHLRPQVLYSQIVTDADNVLRIPEWFVNGQVAYENLLFKGNLQVQIGVEMHWHSAYMAMGYDPVIQNFYNQDEVITPAYLLADVFFTAKMKRGRFFFKYYNIGQLFTGVGSMPTPYYRGAPNLLDFGIDMLLFD
jgi:hypothetical protein